MKRFLVKLGLFLLPLFAIFLPCYFHLKSRGEMESHAEMVRRNQDHGDLIGLAYTDPGYKLKHIVVEDRVPSTIALGTSRVLEVRDIAFRQPTAFYNCGRSVSKMKDYRAFIESYPAKYPELMIVGMDQDLFNGKYDDLVKPARHFNEASPDAMSRFIHSSKAVIKSFKKGRIDDGEVKLASGIGVNAQLHFTGFRADGSYRYGNYIGEQLSMDNYQFEREMGELAADEEHYCSANEINPAAVALFEEFLQVCHERKIKVVVFLPPYAQTVIDKMAETPEKYPHVFKLFEAIEPICQRHDVELFDFTEMRRFGSNDFESIDGLHGSEVCYLRMLIKMAEQNQEMARVLDLKKCQSLLENAYSSRQIIKEMDELNAKPVRH